MKNKSFALRLAVRLTVLAASLGLLVFVLVWALQWYYSLDRYMEKLGDTPLLTLSPGTALVEEGAQLEISLPERLADYSQIYYTLDGSMPTRESPQYTGPVPLPALQGRGCWPVKVLVCQGDVESPVEMRTYFPAQSAALHSDILVVSLSGNPDDFYDQETGILSLGAETPEAALANPDLPMDAKGEARANFYGRGREWERPVTLEVYSAEGQRLLLQQAGVRVTGGYSRSEPIKSLRLYARREYEELSPKFTASLFTPQLSADGSETPVQSFNHIDLRNGGNDWNGTLLSDAGMRFLANDAGLAPIGLPQPAVVYLNGEYYGLMWMQPDYCEKNIAEWCNLHTPESIQVLEAAEGAAYSASFPTAYDDYIAMYDGLAMQDLTIQANADALEAAVDIDNFLLYYALEMYCNNEDWPHNNYKIWRYTGATPEEAAANPYADGRWRFLLYDTDFAFGTHADSVEGFEWALGVQQSPMLVSVLANPGFRDRFVNIWSRLLATSLSPQFAHDTLFAAKDVLEAEMLYRESADPEELLFDGNLRQIYYLKMEDFLTRRPVEIQANILQYFGMERQYTLDVESPAKGATLWLDGHPYRNGQGLTAPFYQESSVTFTCQVAPGYRFAGWQVNGQLHTQPTLILGPFAEEDAVQTMSVRLLLQPDDDALPRLAQVSYRNEVDWVEVQNLGGTAVSLAGYTLQKDGQLLYQLPAVTLQGGESLRVLDERNDFSYEDLGYYFVYMDNRRDAVLSLHDAEGRLVNTVTLPAKNVGYTYRLNPNGPGWVWAKQQLEE